MNTKKIIPPLTIAGYVSNILVIENEAYSNDFVLPLYANGSPTIVFQTAKASKKNTTVGHFTLYGQTIQPDELLIKDGFTLIAYFLHPHSLKGLFEINASDLTNCFIDLNAVKQAREINFQEQLLNATSLVSRLQLLDNFILQLSATNRNDNRKVHFATTTLKENSGMKSLTEIQRELNTTERSLQRMFENNVGISPRMYSRICQFQSAFQQLNQHQFSQLSDIAYDNSFADQSHFIRVFKEFTNITPKEYLAISAPYNPRF
jgi:AraC-like DNA-binding protein